MDVVDLRSDTVTRPGPAMRRTMAEAEVGDDVYGEDTTVNRLQDELADRAGMEAGLFFPSGTMSNQAALAAHTRRGVEVLAPEGAHVYEYELGAMSALSGLTPRLLPAPDGQPEARDLRAAVHAGLHQAPTGLVVLENTHNRAGGTVLSLSRQAELVGAARACGLPVHLDGARAFNAATALGAGIDEVCRGFDSASLCLSKGLGAPVGTVLVGSLEVIREAHRYRKMFGGGMRQAGVLAAAGLYAVRHGAARLGEDHARARALAEGLADVPGVEVDLARVQTNMVYLRVAGAPELAAELAEDGVRVNAVGPESIRMVTHQDVGDPHIERALRVVADRVASRRAA